MAGLADANLIFSSMSRLADANLVFSLISNRHTRDPSHSMTGSTSFLEKETAHSAPHSARDAYDGMSSKMYL
jgi:hypothetical protein